MIIIFEKGISIKSFFLPQIPDLETGPKVQIIKGLKGQLKLKN